MGLTWDSCCATHCLSGNRLQCSGLEKGEPCCATPHPGNPRRKLSKRRSCTTQRLDRQSASGAAEGSMRTVRGVSWLVGEAAVSGGKGDRRGGALHSQTLCLSAGREVILLLCVCAVGAGSEEY